MTGSPENLWRHGVWCPLEGVTQTSDILVSRYLYGLGCPKIADLERAVLHDKYISTREVTVHDVLFM